jgi:hypothetical protein
MERVGPDLSPNPSSRSIMERFPALRSATPLFGGLTVIPSTFRNMTISST